MLIYLGLSMLFFGRALAGGLSSFYVGNGPDPPQSIWFVAWWAHALAARLGLPTVRSFTNFVCVGIGTRVKAEAMVGALLEAGVFVRKPWAPPLDGYVRVTVGTVAERALLAERFVEALDRVREKAAW